MTLGAMTQAEIAPEKTRSSITDANRPGEAELQTGMRYLSGNGEPQDIDKASRHFRIAAARGHADAQAILGVCYAYGQGVEQSDEEAMKWLRLAAEQGLAEAQAALASCCEEEEKS